MENLQTVKHSTHSGTVYIPFTTISFPYNLYTCTKQSCWNRRVFKTVSGSSVETQVCAAAGATADTQQ